MFFTHRQNSFFHIPLWLWRNEARIASSCWWASCILAEPSRCQVPVPQDRFNFSSTISAGELQADRLRNRTTPGRTLAVLKGLFKVLVGLTPREIEGVRNGVALQCHGFIISGSTTGSAETGEEGVHAFVLHRCPGGFTLKWKTCPVYPHPHPPTPVVIAAAHQNMLSAICVVAWSRNLIL